MHMFSVMTGNSNSSQLSGSAVYSSYFLIPSGNLT